MAEKFGPKLTSSEYEILKAVPLSQNYTQVAEKAKFSVAYVSRKLKALREKVTFRAIFDLEAIGLKQMLILAEYDPEFAASIKEVKIPFILFVAHLVSGKKDYLWLHVAPPAERSDEFVDWLQLKILEKHVVEDFYTWRPDTAMLTTYENGYVAGDLEKLGEVYETVSTERPRAKIRRIPDEIDLWLMNILMEYPFTKLSREAAKEGIRQQVASYHLIRHVRPLWLYNVVRLKIDPDQVPTKVYYFGTSDNESAKRLAATLVQTPYVPVSFVEGNKVFAYTTIPTGLEMKLVRSVRAIDSVEEFNEIAAMEKDLILEITRPFGRDVGGGRWIMDRFYQAVRALRVKKEEA